MRVLKKASVKQVRFSHRPSVAANGKPSFSLSCSRVFGRKVLQRRKLIGWLLVWFVSDKKRRVQMNQSGNSFLWPAASHMAESCCFILKQAVAPVAGYLRSAVSE